MSSDALTPEELEEESAEALPDREAMSVIDPGGWEIAPPPLDDGSAPPQPEPLKGGEQL
jgi:hypothetical protein